MTRQRSEPSGNETLELREVAAAVRGRKWLVVAVTVLVAGLAGLYSYTRVPTYESKTEMLVRPILTNPLETNPQDSLSLQTEMRLVTSAAVADVARRSLGPRYSVTDLLKRVSVESPADTQIIEITFRDSDPRWAQRGARAFAEAYLQFKSQQASSQVARYTATLSTQLTKLQEEIRLVNRKILALSEKISAVGPGSAAPADLLGQRDAFLQRRGTLETSRQTLETQLTTLTTLSNDPGQIIQPALLPRSPSSPKHQLDLALGILVGLAAGVAIAWARERVADRIQGRTALEHSLGAPVLGVIPRSPTARGQGSRVVTLDQPRSRSAEAYRTLRTNLVALGGKRPPKSILITSAWMGEGKSTTAANLATVLAQIGKEVVLISADLRFPRVHTFFDIPNDQGLGQVLQGELPLAEALWDSPVANLRILPSGPSSEIVEPVELLQSDRMRRVLAECGRADFVLLDGPPVSGVADSLVLAAMVDGVLFVADARGGEREAVVQSRYQLEQVGGHLLGGVLNGLVGPKRTNSYLPPETRRGGFLSRILLTEQNGNGRNGSRDRSSRTGASEPDPAPRR
ncbi:MAG: polysaccharide biosynthesis tyrosine autokinase [Candidatus Velamenicoccus archaeovorus]